MQHHNDYVDWLGIYGVPTPYDGDGDSVPDYGNPDAGWYFWEEDFPPAQGGPYDPQELSTHGNGSADDQMHAVFSQSSDWDLTKEAEAYLNFQDWGYPGARWH